MAIDWLLRAQDRESLRVAGLRQGIGLGGRLGKGHESEERGRAPGPT